MTPAETRLMAFLPIEPFPILLTPRLLLRQIALSDANELFALRSNTRLMQYVPRPVATGVNEVQQLISEWLTATQAGHCLHFAITLKENNVVIGHMLLFNIKPEHSRGEVGYMLAAEHAGKGYTTEALQAMVAFAFGTLGMHSLEAVIHPENKASAKVLQKAGFVQEAYFRENFFWNGQFEDSAVYSLLQNNSADTV
jgi:[ribosomal protein S5]-alanine N-acetyltransferase